MKKLLILLSFGALLFPACKNDIDINAPHKEIMVVYGLLDINDTAHYIKVNKAFTTDKQTTFEVAQNPDSIFFDSLRVTLYDLSDGSQISFNKDNSLPKDGGLFNSAYNYLYKSTAALNAAHRYRIEVLNPISGNKATSETNLVGDPSKISPITTTLNNNFLIDPAKNYVITFETGSFSYIYDVTVRLYYDETIINSGITTAKSIDYNISRGTRVESNKFNLRTEAFAFYSFLAETLSTDNNINRRATALEVEIYGGEEEIRTYQQANTPSIGVTQKKSDYTNIKNGYGLFSSRNKFTVRSDAPLSNLNNGLRSSPVTARLRFL